ncbi:MAG: hypothetical protein CML99_07300 [Rhodobiaceae bacterium]|nr:hypothetical protein [Rhodobiaceae bacterium]
MNRLNDAARRQGHMQRLSPNDIIREYATRKRRARWLILLGPLIAFGAFFLGVGFAEEAGEKAAGLIIFGGMVVAFSFFGLGIHTARCPVCNKTQIRRVVAGRWRIELSTQHCLKCGVPLHSE